MITLVEAKAGSSAVHGLRHEIVYFPPGRHTITAMVGGRAKTLEATVDERTATTLQLQLELLLAENVRPCIDYGHRPGPAAALPTWFRWDPNGPALVEAIEGRDYSYFSPTFLADKYGRPVGLPAAGAIGALSSLFESMPVAFQQHF